MNGCVEPEIISVDLDKEIKTNSPFLVNLLKQSLYNAHQRPIEQRIGKVHDAISQRVHVHFPFDC